MLVGGRERGSAAQFACTMQLTGLQTKRAVVVARAGGSGKPAPKRPAKAPAKPSKATPKKSTSKAGGPPQKGDVKDSAGTPPLPPPLRRRLLRPLRATSHALLPPPPSVQRLWPALPVQAALWRLPRWPEISLPRPPPLSALVLLMP